MSKKYPKLLQTRDDAVQKANQLIDRTVSLERQLKESHLNGRERTVSLERQLKQSHTNCRKLSSELKSTVQPVLQSDKSFATRTWPLVAKVLGITGPDLTRICKASKHMHDTISNDWNESCQKRTEMVVRLRSAGRILLTHLFNCVRVKKTTVPLNDVIQVICTEENNNRCAGGKALEEIRKAVQSAVSERRFGDAKLLLTLSMSSFDGTGSKLKVLRDGGAGASPPPLVVLMLPLHSLVMVVLIPPSPPGDEKVLHTHRSHPHRV